MIFNHSERFKEEEKPALSYANFSEYLRQQFLNSRKMFAASASPTSSRPASARPMSARPVSARPGSASPHRRGAFEDGFDSPETNFEKPVYFQERGIAMRMEDEEDRVIRSPARKKRGKKGSNSTNNLSDMSQSGPWRGSPQGFLRKGTKRVVPSVQHLNNDTPGPGSYNVSGTLVKSSFNRVYSEPSFATGSASVSGASLHQQPSYLRSTTASVTKKLDSTQAAPLLNARGAFFNSTKKKGSSKSSTPKSFSNPRESYNPHNPFSTLNPYSNAKFYKYKGKKSIPTANTHKKIAEMSVTASVSGSTTLYGTRYPPASDKIMKRWVSITGDSFPDYSKKKGNDPSLFRSSKVL